LRSAEQSGQQRLVALIKQLGLAHGKCPQAFEALFGLSIARVSSVQCCGARGWPR
jgi:hypothetical protein